jgi:hypothetical protein
VERGVRWAVRGRGGGHEWRCAPGQFVASRSETPAIQTIPGISRHFAPDQRKAIRQWLRYGPGFRNAVEKACPHAALVYGLFHVVAKYSPRSRRRPPRAFPGTLELNPR